MNIIGRKQEQALLERCYTAEHPDFVAVYGRRRIGKTYLIKEYFNNRFTFYASGMAEEKTATQLQNFHLALQEYFEGDFPAPANWLEAFVQLERLVKAQKTKEKKVIFLDELPWLDTPKSGFLTALEHFWNSFASSRPDILLIVCGSATSWMVSNLIDNYGGLHNRITEQILLQPFTLLECEEYFRSMGIVYNRYQIAESYMIFGGIPYYMSRMKSMYGLNQNVDMLLFAKTASLSGEFLRLFHSLFRNSNNHIQIVRLLSDKTEGLTRKEIIGQSGIPDGGGLTKVLVELEQCGFIESYEDYNKRRNGEYYKLIDFFSLFYLKYVENNKSRDEHFWTNYLLNPAHKTWCGYAFERVCMMHAAQIKSTLGISGVSTNIFSWRSKSTKPSAQIDMILDRKDSVINLCEIKYSVAKYAISKSDDEDFLRRRTAFLKETGTKSALHQTLITTYGLEHNAYCNNIQSEITLDDLFR
ncbi:MAG: AAA family ATPase [Clostridiales Family XIII bacterium]|jgi:AAA+ ATPase superfamily predicted ATPase|nr:AAA family ATPase [Clostridiales Family XIII bacterium]